MPELILSDTVSGSSVAPREQYPSSRSALLTCTDRANRAFRFTNSVICWTTEYYGMGIGELRGQGRDVPDELLSFIAPGHRENINFFGFISVDIEAELAKLIEGWRPLRPAAVHPVRMVGLTGLRHRSGVSAGAPATLPWRIGGPTRPRKLRGTP